MDLMIVRHSRSISNHADLISGASNDVALSEQGVAYAEQVRHLYDWDRFDAVYASPMTRARQTADILTANRDDITFDARLQEMDFGDWDGLDATPFRSEYPDAFDYSGMFSETYSNYAPNAESYDDLLARCHAFIDDMKVNHAHDAVLVVCHGLTIRGLLAAALNSDIYNYTAVKNVSLNEVHLDADDNFRGRLLRFNEVLA